MNATTDAYLPQDDTAERLIEALNEDGFVLYQQPIVPLRPAPGLEPYQEILIRFREEEEKLLPPGTFIPILESSRLMHILDRWVVNRVIKWVHARRKKDPLWKAPRSSINLSNDSLTNPDVAGFVKEQLQKGRVSGRKFSFEVAEADGHDHIDALAAVASALTAEGCSMTLTSYTGDLIRPDRLESLGIDAVKLDIDIVTSLHANAEAQRKAGAVQERCAAFGVRTIAEFVEQPATLDRLKKLGVDYAQGYGIERPAVLA